jgi:hypothetical protein
MLIDEIDVNNISPEDFNRIYNMVTCSVASNESSNFVLIRNMSNLENSFRCGYKYRINESIAIINK